MAAPVVTPEQNRGTLRGKIAAKKKKSLKQVLSSPYNVSWPAVEKQTEVVLLERIKKELSQNFVTRPRVPQQIRRNKQQMKKWREEQRKVEDIASKATQSSVYIGINRVTKGLERDEVSAVIVDRDVPVMMTRHLMLLAATRDCPAVCLSGLSSVIGPVVGMKSVAAISFKKSVQGASTLYDDLVEFVSSHAPVLQVPWLVKEEEEESEDSSSAEERDPDLVDTSNKYMTEDKLSENKQLHPQADNAAKAQIIPKSADRPCGQNLASEMPGYIGRSSVIQQAATFSTNKSTGYISFDSDGPQTSKISHSESGKRIYYAPAYSSGTSILHLYLLKSELNNPDEFTEFIPHNYRSLSPEPELIPKDTNPNSRTDRTQTLKDLREKTKVTKKRKLDNPRTEDVPKKRLKKKSGKWKKSVKEKKNRNPKYQKARQMAQQSNPNRKKKQRRH
ncbi:uncharacterized protein LOC106166727 [Lingula anatina]|uniref:Uncharacterized protein LOC106166727 n=1 Tax=Lingula anatina TaxID=7574 RepID=A0A1S3ISB0_LINAN|nr:uncharacterized protein LOC106166727 [Lingula anatina]|eukprot:XP_013400826.1 uncharacterized protein LOC106166727 [Lingula anatina]